MRIASGRTIARNHLVAAALACFASISASGQQASAMECSKAASKIDHAICDDKALKAQDAQLSRDYFEMLKHLSGARHDVLINEQRSWLKTRAEECTNAKNGLKGCLSEKTGARIKTLGACFGETGPDPKARDVVCSVEAHAACPRSVVYGSAALCSYPFLVANLNEEASRVAKESEDKEACVPEDADHPGTPDQNESFSSMSIEGSGEGWVTVASGSDGYARGAAHPWHSEEVKTYHSMTGAAFPITELMPRLLTDSRVSGAIWSASNEQLDLPCCGQDDELKRRTLDDLDTEVFDRKAASRPLPDAWSVAPGGGIELYYSYNELGRTFVAKSKLKPSRFIGLVDARYKSLFSTAD